MNSAQVRRKSRDEMNDKQKTLALTVQKKAIQALQSLSTRNASFSEIKEILQYATELERSTADDNESAADGIHEGRFIKGLFERPREQEPEGETVTVAEEA